MSISGAMFNALTGLTAASRGIEVVSANVSNAGVEGYARRELELSSRVLGGQGAGVSVDGLRRIQDPRLLGDLRLADAGTSAGEARLGFNATLQQALGTAGQDGSLSDRVATLQATLIEAAARPDSQPRLQAAVTAAADLAGQLNDASDAVQQARMRADADIAETVATLNDDLSRVRDLNVMIQKLDTSGRDTAAAIDQRQGLIDEISRIVPVRELPRPNGMVALVTPAGQFLLKSQPVQVDFSPVGIITADMTLASGALSGLSVNGKPVDMAGGGGMLGGGSLGALFDIRDGLAPDAQGMLDAVARDLYTRFADPVVDPSLASGQPGLFTDGTGAFDPVADPASEVGLAGRLAVTAAVDPGRGGALWRMTAGIGAGSAGAAGDGSRLSAMAAALVVPRSPASGPFGPVARDAGALAGEAMAIAAGDGSRLEKGLAFATARADTLREQSKRDGVDTDAEMQNLLTLEQAYAANARVVSALDEVLQAILSI